MKYINKLRHAVASYLVVSRAFCAKNVFGRKPKVFWQLAKWLWADFGKTSRRKLRVDVLRRLITQNRSTAQHVLLHAGLQIPESVHKFVD